MKIWRSYDKKKFAQFFWDTVYTSNEFFSENGLTICELKRFRRLVWEFFKICIGYTYSERGRKSVHGGLVPMRPRGNVPRYVARGEVPWSWWQWFATWILVGVSSMFLTFSVSFPANKRVRCTLTISRYLPERQAWCYLQVKLCDPRLRVLSVVATIKALYKFTSFLFLFTSRGGGNVLIAFVGFSAC